MAGNALYADDGSLRVSVAAAGGNVASNAAPLPTLAVSSQTVFRLLSSAASTNLTVAKAGAGVLSYLDGYNANAAARYLKVYNKATAPNLATDVPVFTEYLPASTKFTLALRGHFFSAGIAFALTTGAPDNDTGAISAADIQCLNLFIG